MRDRVFALLVHESAEPFATLKRTLADLGVHTFSVTTCQEAKHLIAQCQPHLVFTETALADGSWMRLSRMADDSDVPLSVIVVGSQPDPRQDVVVMERGAFDFIAPPFAPEALEGVVRSATLDVHRRREASVRAVLV
jgi:DNA-binding NtrC family response regulator